MTSTDTIVIGAGAMGSATAWQLAKRGREVTLIEQFSAGHKNGASHGETRNFNVAYSEPEYIELLVESLRLWRELESDADTTLLDLRGLIGHGPGDHYATVFKKLTGTGIPAEMLTADEAAERWGGIRFDSAVLFNREAGTVNANASVAALQAVAARHGAEVLHNTRVVDIQVLGPNHVSVSLETGETLTASRVVVTVGAWTEKLLGNRVALPRLVVTQEQPAHFAIRDESVDWPSFNHRPGVGEGYDYWYSPVYGMETVGEGIKAGWHGTGPVVDPDHRDFTPEPVQRAALQRYARDWLPGVDSESLVDISCTYTSTDSTDFVLDAFGPIVVGAGFSGHGFKFTPAIGRILADLATGVSRPAEIFRAAR